ncbi:MAG: hypothetical protein V1699_06075 [Candidatus Omnitrophota bacterium]
MNKKNEKKIVKIAEREVSKFVKEWKKYPYLWDSETDVHGELYVRIKGALEHLDKTTHCYKKYMNKEARFERVYCNPLTYIKKGERYHPDIVIYEGSGFNDGDKKVNEPMLWVCEIKYKTQWGNDQSEINRKYDKRKLRILLRQQANPEIRGTKYAYFLELVRTKEKALPDHGPVELK